MEKNDILKLLQAYLELYRGRAASASLRGDKMNEHAFAITTYVLADILKDIGSAKDAS